MRRTKQITAVLLAVLMAFSPAGNGAGMAAVQAAESTQTQNEMEKGNDLMETSLSGGDALPGDPSEKESGAPEDGGSEEEQNPAGDPTGEGAGEEQNPAGDATGEGAGEEQNPTGDATGEEAGEEQNPAEDGSGNEDGEEEQPGENAEEDQEAVSDNTAEAVSDNTTEREALAVEKAAATGSLAVTGDTDKYSYDETEDKLTIMDGAELTISSAKGYSEENPSATIIYVEKDANANLTLDGLYIDMSGTGDLDARNAGKSPLLIEQDSTGDVTISIKGKNVLKAGVYCAAIQKNGQAASVGQLTISGEGELAVVGGINAAGIGGGVGGSVSNIRIQGGTIAVTGGAYATAIGEGYMAICGSMVITGGSIRAKRFPATRDQEAVDYPITRATDGTNPVAQTIVDLSAVYGPEAAVTDVTGTDYNFQGVKTDKEGKIYLYLPKNEENTDTEICFKGRSFIGFIGDDQKNELRELTAPDLIVEGDPSGYTYNRSARIFYVKDGAELTFHSAEGHDSTNLSESTICVEKDANASLTLDGVYIDASGTEWKSPLEIEKGSTGDVTLLIKGENVLNAGRKSAAIQKNGNAASAGKLTISGDGKLTATGGYLGAGIGSCSRASTANIVIAGGTVITTGGGHGAGIGGGESGSATDITIAGGTVTATGGNYGAGIGGGDYGNAANITITGGTVTTTGGGLGAGIGSYKGNATNITIAGGTVKVIGGYNGPEIGSADNVTITGGTIRTSRRIVGEEEEMETVITGASNGKEPVYRTIVDLKEDYGTQSPVTEVMETGYGMNGVYTDGEGKIAIYLPATPEGEQTRILFGKNYYAGTISSEEGADNRLTKQDETCEYDLNVYGDPAFYERETDTETGKSRVVVKDGAKLTFHSPEGYSEENPTKTTIYVEDGAGARLTLDGVYIDVSDTGDSRTAGLSPLEVAKDSAGNIEVILKGTNVLKAGYLCAGLQKNGEEDSVGKLTISGEGELQIAGGDLGAGIGGGRWEGERNITISGGTVTATGGEYGAGIGGGNYQGDGVDITISGGNVTATGGRGGGAGIGGAVEGAGNNIRITGGNVTATGDTGGGAGIGGGIYTTRASNIAISGGTVIAAGQGGASGIGDGMYKQEGTLVTIAGGCVNANGISNGAKGSDGQPVYPARVDLMMLSGRQAKVGPVAWYTCKEDGSENAQIGYGSSELYTLSDGYLYVYLPANEEGTVTRADFGNTVYEGTIVAIPAEETEQYNELLLKSSTDGKAEPGEVIREDVPEEGVPDGLWIAGLNEEGYVYTGKAIKPEIRVYDGKRLLVEKKDYTITYKNNVNAAAADSGKKAPLITVKSKGNYKGTATKTFTIQPMSLRNANDDWVEGLSAPDLYLAAPTGKNPKGIKAVPVVTYNGVRLKENRDYTLDHQTLNEQDKKNGNKNSYSKEGNYEIWIIGKGNYTGRIGIYAKIVDTGKDSGHVLMSKVSVAKIPDVTYDEEKCIGADSPGMKPKLTVTYGTGKNKITLYTVGDTDADGNTVTYENADYTVIWENNKQTGTATAVIVGNGRFLYGSDEMIGTYFGEKRITFKIKGAALKANMVSWEEANSIIRTYNGEAQEPEVLVSTTRKVKDENGKTVNQQDILTKYDESTGKGDYTVTYLKNVDAGTATAVITGVNGYTGTVKKTFKITPVDLTGKDTAATIRAAGDDETSAQIKVSYAKNGAKPQIQVTANLEAARQDATEAGTNTVTLEEGKDYTVSYANNKAVSEGKNLTVKKQPTITIKGKGNYKGSLQQTFVITAKSLADSESPLTITVADVAANKTKGKFVSKPVVTDADGGKLKEKTDYTLTYTLLSAGGTTEEKQLDPKKDAVDVAGSRIRVTITGAGNYAGENSVLTADYRVTERDFAKASFKIVTKSFSYTGKPVELTADDLKITFKTGSGKKAVTEELTRITDGDTTKDGYVIVGYQNNVNKGTAQITLKGCGKYGGTKTLKYTIGTRAFLWWTRG